MFKYQLLHLSLVGCSLKQTANLLKILFQGDINMWIYSGAGCHWNIPCLPMHSTRHSACAIPASDMRTRDLHCTWHWQRTALGTRACATPASDRRTREPHCMYVTRPAHSTRHTCLSHSCTRQPDVRALLCMLRFPCSPPVSQNKFLVKSTGESFVARGG